MKNERYDYLVVGAGLYGATIAQQLHENGKSVLVIEKRDHIAGNCYTYNKDGIEVHKYGPHIFHTNNDEVWNYVNRFTKFNNFINSPKAMYKGELYSLPFNMNTFHEMWGCTKPDEAKAIIDKQIIESGIVNPKNLEEQAISLVGKDIFEVLIKGYTEKQWGKPCTELDPSIIKRLPIRFNYDNNYFNAKYQGIPTDGYTCMVEKMLDGIKVLLNEDYLENRSIWGEIADNIIYTGPIDALFEYRLGNLEYRSLEFKTYQALDTDNFQGNAVINYTNKSIPYTRIIEHKWFTPNKAKHIDTTIISYEYSVKWDIGAEPYYPINNISNNKKYEDYKACMKGFMNFTIGGRLGDYKYYDMDKVIELALKKAKELLS